MRGSQSRWDFCMTRSRTPRGIPPTGVFSIQKYGLSLAPVVMDLRRPQVGCCGGELQLFYWICNGARTSGPSSGLKSAAGNREETSKGPNYVANPTTPKY